MRISNEKREKISEQILAFLFSLSPKTSFTYHISKEIARDEEFTKKLLNELKSKKYLVEIKKNAKGDFYTRRSKWALNDEVYKLYLSKQNK